LDVAEDFEFEVEKIGNLSKQDKLIKMKEKKMREK